MNQTTAEPSGRGHIEIDGVTKTYASDAGDITALEGIDFDIAPREFVGIVGPSGCGKSTLLRCVGGLRSSPPTSPLYATTWGRGAT